ncbi:MAG TPA: 3-dehydroquinate synthase [Terriglobia bacterium]|nr:3-dehydroquinate synthase [Terriglobia bacterium]
MVPAKLMRRFVVTAERSRYPVVVGRGAWRELRKLVARGYSSVFILTERVIWRRWGETFSLEAGLEGAPGAPQVITIPGGERSKSLAQAERVADALAKRGADRRSLLVLFGGGVIGDLGGFVASTYMRGIDAVQAPTTLVGQVDSAVGGKTAVNVGASKNLVGTFYPPRLVLAEPAVLGSLSQRIFRSGLYEVAKHAILAGPELFDRLERTLATLGPGDTAALETMVAKAVKVKVDVVNRDEREGGLRHVLNLGHTFGHALEAATGYRRFLHGEAVGWGLLAVALLAERLGHLTSRVEAGRIRGLVRAIGPLPSIGGVAPAKIARLLPRDKKTVAGTIHWVMPERIGKVRIVTGVPLAAAEAAWRELQQGNGANRTLE